MISRIRIASVGRDLGIQIHRQEMLEWREHLREIAVQEPGGKQDSPVTAGDSTKDALSTFTPPMKEGTDGKDEPGNP